MYLEQRKLSFVAVLSDFAPLQVTLLWNEPMRKNFMLTCCFEEKDIQDPLPHL